MPSSVVRQTPVRLASTAAALVKEHDAIFLGVEKASHPGFRATAGATVQEHRWLSLRIAAFFEIDAMIAVHAKVAGAVGFDGGIQGTRLTRSDYHTCLPNSLFRRNDEVGIGSNTVIALSSRRLPRARHPCELPPAPLNHRPSPLLNFALRGSRLCPRFKPLGPIYRPRRSRARSAPSPWRGRSSVRRCCRCQFDLPRSRVAPPQLPHRRAATGAHPVPRFRCTVRTGVRSEGRFLRGAAMQGLNAREPRRP